MSERVRIWALLAGAVLVYGNTLVNGFTMDDNMYVVSNAQVTHFTLKGLFAPTPYNNVFRPATFGSYALDWFVGGARPAVFHLVNVLLHALVTLLLYLVLRKLLATVQQGDIAAWVAALLFAVHPLHTEAVASIAGRSELLAMAFLLAAWLLHLKDLPLLALVSFLVALLSKESAVVFLPLVLAGDYARGRMKPWHRYSAILATAVAYLALLWRVQGGRFGEKGINFLDNPLAHLPATVRILNAFRIAWKYLGLHVYPATLSSDYSYNAIPLYANARHTAPALIAAALVLALWFWALWTGRKEWVLAGAIYLAAFAVTGNILLPTGTIMGERLAYLPSAGFCLLVALFWLRFEQQQRTIAWALLGIVVIALSVRTVVRNRDWHDNIRLFSADAKAVPGSAKIHSNLGAQYFSLGEVDRASRELQTALSIYPNLPDALGYEGLVEFGRGHEAEARRLLEKALSLTSRESPNYDFIAVNLAAVEMKLGANGDALKILDEETTRFPNSTRAWSNRAVLRFERGETGAARSDAETALQLDPTNVQAQNLLGILNQSLTALPKP
jgi:tetratricopeptide (TPR) repeat protein